MINSVFVCLRDDGLRWTADAIWLTNTGLQEDGRSPTIDLMSHLARLQGNVKHRFMDVAAFGLDEPTRKFLKRIFRDSHHPSVTNIAVNSKSFASQIPSLTNNLARVRMFRPAVNLTKFDLCSGVCESLSSTSSHVRVEYVAFTCSYIHRSQTQSIKQVLERTLRDRVLE